MARDLKLQVILDAVDRVTGPLKNITRGSGKTAEALKASREELKRLNQQQRDISSFRKLKDATRENGEALAAAQEQLKRMREGLKRTDAPSQQFQENFLKAKRKVDGLTDKLGEQRRELGQVRGRLKEAGIGTKDLGSAETRMAEQIRGSNEHLDQQKQKLKQVAQQQRRVQEASRKYQRGVGLANSMVGAGAGGLASGSAALYGGARLLTPGVDYGAQMSAVQAVTRLEKDDPRFKMLKDQSRELGASTAFSAGEVGAGQEFLARANFSPEAIKSSMQEVLNLALANRTELDRAADISSNISSAFKIDPEVEGNMRRVGDILTATTTRANVDLEMLGDTMKYLGAGSGLGLTMEQAAAMAGLLGNIGVQGSQAGTTLRAMMSRLSAPVGKAKDAVSELSLELTDSQGDLRQIPEILSDIAEATENMGNAKRAGYLKAIFGEEAGSGMAELIAQQGQAGVDKFVAILKNAAGENARVAKTRTDNIQGDLQGLNSAWQEIGITITDTNQGPLRELIQNVTEITRGIGNWMKENPELAGTLATVAAGLAATVAVGGGLLVLLGSILGPIAAVRYALTLLSLNPVSLTIMAIVAAVAALAAGAYYVYKHWDGISAWFGERWQQVKDAFDDGIGDTLRLLMNWNPIAWIYRGITAGLEAAGVTISDDFKYLGNAIIDGLIGGIGAKFGALKKKITGVAGSVSGWFKDKLGIKSPSRVFMGHGADTLAGYQKGLAANENAPLKQIGAFGKRMKQAGAGLAIGAASLPAVADIPLDTRAPMSAASGGTVTITIGDINVHPAPGMDEQALARYVASEVQRALAQAERDAGARRRSALYDTD
ncbi:phage tail tape measure protein, TP901 family, core region [Modicisalibacter ilicicola DSM 19980]|uniref:Phage tail tape measure protein, TP901 family, core region n=1 Tax=Modicisalibacter ilicicola DSM 19980 TaxID=1121942 RepID=A0A1M4Y3F1_9GAMM|nr:phage tail tape measure protein [Halomonas ilicicola]SHF00103.1 phage tail tape measure protein, TP901 family, core region [Halomonas ilicicola DSM 19980]